MNNSLSIMAIVIIVGTSMGALAQGNNNASKSNESDLATAVEPMSASQIGRSGEGAAHEATHVTQQKKGQPGATAKPAVRGWDPVKKEKIEGAAD